MIMPNGWSMEPDGHFLMSNLGDSGGVWCATVMNNRLVRVASGGSQQVVLEDCDEAEIARGMGHWRAGYFTRDDMNIGAPRTLANIASITFGGPDLRTGYLGSLFGDSVRYELLCRNHFRHADLGS